MAKWQKPVCLHWPHAHIFILFIFSHTDINNLPSYSYHKHSVFALETFWIYVLKFLLDINIQIHSLYLILFSSNLFVFTEKHFLWSRNKKLKEKAPKANTENNTSACAATFLVEDLTEVTDLLFKRENGTRNE